MKKPMSRLLASVLTAIMLINCMVVTALAADARVISMNYQPHPLYPGMNGNAVVEVDYGDSTGRGICVEPAKDGPAVGSTLSLSEADTTMTRYAYMASQTSDIYRTWCIHHAAANHLGLGNGSRDSGITAVENEVANSMYRRLELDWLIYNDPLAYADLVLNGDPEAYLKAITEYTPLD